MEPLAARYDHAGEDEIYALWEKSGYFAPEKCLADGVAKPDAEVFSIVLPPPNVTGTLHIGHAFEDTLQDIMVRFMRMHGRPTVWVPGTDHAAIATQAKVEKELQKKEGKSRYDLGREEFLRRVQDFAKESHDTIVRQVRKMGASLDWSREAFTLDEKRSLAVRTAFERMYDAGLIYRGYRVVNWDPKGQTVISDDEIVYEEHQAKLYTFKYSADFPFAISTTRPETKFGDTAVAVHSDDPRYRKFLGKTYDVLFLGEPLSIKIIADSSVDREFGTGALGVTPAHSMQDSELAERHGLELKQVIDERGRMMVGPEGVTGEKTAAAGAKTAELLRAAGLLEKEEDISQNVSTAERTGGMVEPLPKLQWFVAVNKEFVLENSKIKGVLSGSKTTLKDIMRKAVEGGQINILPERFAGVYYHWIDNLRDWCISRQIWYGHRIPVWYHEPKCIPRQGHEGDVVKCKEVVISGAEPRCEFCDAKYVQDSDTLDTWFSSGLWTFSTLGWPITKTLGFDPELVDLVKSGEKTVTFRVTDYGLKPDDVCHVENSRTKEKFGVAVVLESSTTVLQDLDYAQGGHEQFKSREEFLAKFRSYYPDMVLAPDTPVHIYKFKYQKKPDLEVYHPTSVVNPGYEILFFWVARMILMSGCLLGEVPFKTALIHGMVRDREGKKYSKSAGRGLDPLELTEKYGADALRMALLAGAAPGNDVKFSEDRVRGYRNFSTKIWNVARFILLSRKPEFDSAKAEFAAEDKQDLEELAKLKASTAELIEKFQFHLAAEGLYHYFWHTFADKIVEAAKPRLKVGDAAAYQALAKILLESLTMLHPFVPFVTEAVYQEMKKQDALPENSPALLMIRPWNTL